MRSSHWAPSFLLVCAAACAPDPHVSFTLPEQTNEGFTLDASEDEPAFEEADPHLAQSRLEAPGSSEDDKYIFGADDRKPVADTSTRPFSSVVFLNVSFKFGGGAGCTGTLVADDAVLTAAHCVYEDKNGGGPVSALVVVPGEFADKFGKGKSLPKIGSTSAVRVFYPAEFHYPYPRDEVASPFDYAVVRLAVPLGRYAGTRRYAARTPKPGQNIRALAYMPYIFSKAVASCEPNKAYQMYQVTGKIGALRPPYFDSFMDGVAGSSGAGITGDGVDAETVFAIETAESAEEGEYNTSLMLTPAMVSNIDRWVKAKVQ